MCPGSFPRIPAILLSGFPDGSFLWFLTFLTYAPGFFAWPDGRLQWDPSLVRLRGGVVPACEKYAKYMG